MITIKRKVSIITVIFTKSKMSLKNKAGASLLFVMAAALLLLIIGVSSLVAAGANAGSGVNRSIKEQLNLYVESLQNTVLSSLQEGKKDIGKEITATKTLGGQILKPIYDKNKSTETIEPEFYTNSIPVKLEFTPSLSNIDAQVYEDVVIDINPIVTVKKEHNEQEIIFNDNGTIKSVKSILYPREITVNAEVRVTVVAKYKDKTLKSIVTYNYSGASIINGKLADDSWDINALAIDDAGEWRFVSHEKIDK